VSATPPEVLHREPATGRAALEAAGSSTRVVHRSTSVSGEPTQMTGLVHLPRGAVPPGGWPVVTYGHMTTGGGGRAAPSLATEQHPELRRMTQGDALVSNLLRGGVAVLRPDYEGIGGPGAHPYLIGASLGRSCLDLLAAARADDERLGAAWVSAGHSEGAVAALYAASVGARSPATGASEVELRGVAAFTPVTRMELTIGAYLRTPVVVPGARVVVPLIALMASGLATVDDRLAELLHDGGLSERARELLPELEQKSLSELARADSWGGLPAARMLGPRGAELRQRLLTGLAEQDVRHLELPRGVPVRLDVGRLDEVAPLPLTDALARGWRRQHVALTYQRWWSGHSGVMAASRAPGPAASWILARLRGGSGLAAGPRG
jgi:Secretory lipase